MLVTYLVVQTFVIFTSRNAVNENLDVPSSVSSENIFEVDEALHEKNNLIVQSIKEIADSVIVVKEGWIEPNDTELVKDFRKVWSYFFGACTFV